MSRCFGSLHRAAAVALVGAGVLISVPTTGIASVRTKAPPSVAAAVASFDPYVGQEQRFIVGIIGSDNRTLAFGEVEFHFGYAGTKEQPIKKVTLGDPIVATYRPIPGSKPAATSGPSRLVAPSKSRGVYGVDNALFDKPGLWGVVVEGTNGTRKFSVDTVFEVAAQPQVTAPGQAAPRSANPLPGTPGVAPTAIDSRASKGTVPDPELHRISIADSIASAKPTMVVVSTPVYCVSQFCGPITDTIQALAKQYGDRMNFVHLEVWSDFQKRQVNDAAGEWIYRRDNGDANEPWVFVVDRTGVVVERFDNVATDQDLQRAIARQVS